MENVSALGTLARLAQRGWAVLFCDAFSRDGRSQSARLVFAGNHISGVLKRPVNTNTLVHGQINACDR